MNKKLKVTGIPLLAYLMMLTGSITYAQSLTYPIVDTDVSECYSDDEIISPPGTGDPFYGQDAQYAGNQSSYTDNGDGTITDNVTGLMWQKEMGEKISYADAFIKADTMSLGGHANWRVPSIKELYSLILFTGQVRGATFVKLFIDEDYFDQPLGNTDIGEREIDAQTWSSTQYVGLTMRGDSTVFGVNFIDGRIKGYPQYEPWSENTVAKTMYFRMVRENPEYGINNFTDNDDGTISDLATGLMWQKADDGNFRDWEEALEYAEGLALAGYDDWRLPNAKELQSILDYSRSPQTSSSPAIDPLFTTTEIDDPDGMGGQYPYFWTSTTHMDGMNPYSSAVYIAFGEAQGIMIDKLLDVHGAGSQRSDPKSGDINDYPQFFGPQGDVRYVYNAVRCVRDINPATAIVQKDTRRSTIKCIPNPTSGSIRIFTENTDCDTVVRVYDATGKLVSSDQEIISDHIVIDLSEREKGLYLVCLLTEDIYQTIQVIKE